MKILIIIFCLILSGCTIPGNPSSVDEHERSGKWRKSCTMTQYGMICSEQGNIDAI